MPVESPEIHFAQGWSLSIFFLVMYKRRAPGAGMRHRRGRMGVVELSHLASWQCMKLHGSSSRHPRLRVRMRQAEYDLEQRRLTGHGTGAVRDYELLVSTGSGRERLELDKREPLTVQMQYEQDGHRHTAEVTLDIVCVRALVAGLRSSELIHRAMVSVAIH